MVSSLKTSPVRFLAPLTLLLNASCALVPVDPVRKDAPLDGGLTSPSVQDGADASVNDGNPTSSPHSESSQKAGSSDSRPHATETTDPSLSAGSADSTISSNAEATTDSRASSETGLSSELVSTADLTDATSSNAEASTSELGATSNPGNPDPTNDPDPTSEEPPPELPCGPLTGDDAVALYVSPFGTDSATCGGPSAPCRTITRGLSRAVAESKPKLFIQSGSYTEHVNLNAPISLVGGWTVSDGVWSRECTTLSDQTEILSPTAVGLRAEFTGAARLQSLTILSKGRDATASESRYGVFATGASTNLQLVDVTVRAGSANHGSNGANGPDGAVGANGPAGGTPKPTPACPAGTGTAGAAPSTTPTTGAGAFAAAGYVPRDGANGANGNPGQAGAVGSDVTYTCTFCSMRDNQCQGQAGGSKTASGGLNGCGGAAGTGGLGGTGGGSSVGVFAWFASVTFGDDVAVISGDGGNGGKGGAGGTGGTGGFGGVGEEVACNPQLSCNSSPCNDKFRGSNGSKGGNGSAGASGGGGAGGWSVAVVNTPGAITGKPLTLVGQAGTSLGLGAAGVAQATYTIP
jgi:hypothetical protein